MNPGVALTSGVVAELAVAVPLGASGVLLLREGVERGLRGGLPAATAVVAAVPAGRSLRRFAVFFGLTLVNPAGASAVRPWACSGGS